MPQGQPFGGAVWHTPFRAVLMVEYDSDTYAQEKSVGTSLPNQVNFGLSMP